MKSMFGSMFLRHSPDCQLASLKRREFVSFFFMCTHMFNRQYEAICVLYIPSLPSDLPGYFFLYFNAIIGK